MAWNPSPKVAAARDYGNKFGFQQVVIISVAEGGQSVDVTTYGRTKRLCEGADKLGQIAWQAILDEFSDEQI